MVRRRDDGVLDMMVPPPAARKWWPLTDGMFKRAIPVAGNRCPLRGSSTGGNRSHCRTTMPGISALRGRTIVRRPQPPSSPLRPHGTAPGPLTSGGLPAADRSNHLAVRPQPCERQRGGDEQQRVQRGDASTNVVLSGLDGAATLSEREHHCRHAATLNPASTPGAAGDRCPHRQIGRRSGLPAPRHDAATPRDRPNETSSRLLAPGTDVS